jgi:hypothetical protein
LSDELPEVYELRLRRASRRELAKALLSGLAAGIVIPSLPLFLPVHKQLLNGTLLDSADEVLASETHKRLFFSEPQFASVERLTETMVPGSRKAQSAAFIDLLLSVDCTESQRDFAAAIAAFETSANQTFHKKIISLSDAQLNELLQTASARSSADYTHFENLKDWTVVAFYSSEIGMRELGWTPDRIFSTFPDCPQAESHS